MYLSAQPLTSQFFLSDIVWHHGSVFTIKFILLSRWYSKSFIHLGQLGRAKQNVLLDEMYPITQWIITNLFIWTYSWHYKLFSEFIANILKKKVTLLKETKKKRKNKQFTFFQTNAGTFLYNPAKQSTRDCISFLSSEQWQSITGSFGNTSLSIQNITSCLNTHRPATQDPQIVLLKNWFKCLNAYFTLAAKL